MRHIGGNRVPSEIASVYHGNFRGCLVFEGLEVKQFFAQKAAGKTPGAAVYLRDGALVSWVKGTNGWELATMPDCVYYMYDSAKEKTDLETVILQAG